MQLSGPEAGSETRGTALRRALTGWVPKVGLSVAVGAFFLWLALRQVDLRELRRAFSLLNPAWCVAGVALYWIALFLRILRWRYILNAVTSLSVRQVTLGLLTGYAVNAILPARLGELFRADFCRRRYLVPRSTTLGTILVERLTDGMIVMAALFVGLLALGSGQQVSNLNSVLIGGSFIFGTVGVALYLLGSQWVTGLFARFPRADRLHAFHDSIQVLRRPRMLGVLLLSVAVWFFDGGALWAILRAAGVDIGFLAMSLILGVVSLSTLLPSPPGFVGTMQFAYVIAVQAFGYASSQGILAATANQVLLIGSMVAVGLALLGGSQLKTVLRGFERPSEP
jgi:glycosyltransferase 2 family protein